MIDRSSPFGKVSRHYKRASELPQYKLHFQDVRGKTGGEKGLPKMGKTLREEKKDSQMNGGELKTCTKS